MDKMMRSLMVCLALFLIVSGVCADQVLLYKVYDEESREERQQLTFQIGEPMDGQILIHWQNQQQQAVLEHTVDTNYATRCWHLTVSKEDTDYTGERQGNKLVLRGRHKGELLDKVIEIDEKPFFFQPVVGLMAFVRSGAESLEFHSLRPDNLKHYRMKARREATEAIQAGGEKVQAVRVKWGATGLLGRFFSQTYWFRESDGVYLRSKPSFGSYTVFAGEQTLPEPTTPPTTAP